MLVEKEKPASPKSAAAPAAEKPKVSDARPRGERSKEILQQSSPKDAMDSLDQLEQSLVQEEKKSAMTQEEIPEEIQTYNPDEDPDYQDKIVAMEKMVQ